MPFFAMLAPKALSWLSSYFKYIAVALVALAVGYAVYSWLQAKDAKLEEQATKLAEQAAQVSALESSLATLRFVQEQYAKEVETLRAKDEARAEAARQSETILRATPLRKNRDATAPDKAKSDAALLDLNADFNGVLLTPR